MSLETLLEAAKYLEYRSQVKARGEEPHDYDTFSRLFSDSNDITNSIIQPSPSYRSQQSASDASYSNDEVREPRRRTSSTTKDSSSQDQGGSGTREVHNKLEKNRRAHLKECFEALKKQLPNMDERKTSNLSILRGAIRFIQIMKRKERDYEHDLERLAREKIAFQQRLSSLKKELSSQYDHIDVNAVMTVEENETTTTASECGALSDVEDDIDSDQSLPPSKVVDVKPIVSNAMSSLHSSNSRPRNPVSDNVVTTTVTKQASVNNAATVSRNAPSSKPKKESYTTSVNNLHDGVETSNSVTSSIDMRNGQRSKVIPTGNLHTVTGILPSSQTLQVMTSPSSFKMLTAVNSTAPTIPVSQISTGHHSQGQLHMMASTTVPLVASSSGTIMSSKAFIAEPPVHITDTTLSSKKQLMSPVTLVSSPTFVGLTQVSNSPKSMAINQTSGFSELLMSGASNTLNTSQVLMKPSLSPVFGANMALTVKNCMQGNNLPLSSATHSSSTLPTIKLGQPITQLTSAAAQNNSTLISSEGLSRIGHQSAMSSARGHSCNLLTHPSNMAHIVSQSPITVSAAQFITPGNQVSGMTSLMGPVSVVSHTGALHQQQILAQSQSIGKVLASPILKPIGQVNQIPIIQQQFLQAAGSVTSQPIVKPVVVVSMPSIIPSGGISSLTPGTVISSHEQQDAVCNAVSVSQK